MIIYIGWICYIPWFWGLIWSCYFLLCYSDSEPLRTISGLKIIPSDIAEILLVFEKTKITNKAQNV